MEFTFPNVKADCLHFVNQMYDLFLERDIRPDRISIEMEDKAKVLGLVVD